MPLTWFNSSESNPPLAPHVHDEVVSDPPPDALVLRNVHDTAECIPRPTNTVLPSVHFRRIIPWPLQVPLSLVPPERVQVSPIAGGDLDMTLYVLFGSQVFTMSRGLNHNMLVA